MYTFQILCALLLVTGSLASKCPRFKPIANYTTIEINQRKNNFTDFQIDQRCNRKGTLIIVFKDVIAIEDSDGQDCDTRSTCDTYVKLLIDGKVVYRTATVYNSSRPKFGVIVQSNVCDDSTIGLEMWDEDHGFFQREDDLMLKFTFKNVYELGDIRQFFSGRNFMKISSSFSQKS